MKQLAGLTLALFIGHAAAARGEVIHEVTSGTEDRESTAVTVYNDDLALIKERRKVNLTSGMTRLSLREVSAQMRPETALLRAVTGSPISLIEQSFDFDLLTPQTLLAKYVGKEVTILRSHPTTGEEKSEKATVLANNGGTVLRFADRIETGAPGRIVFGSVPANLRDRPTLSVLLDGNGGNQSLELSYLTGGLRWKADYVANLASGGKHMNLSGWVTLTNQSGAAYTDARLQLVAGNVNRVYERQERMPMPLALAASAPRAKAVMSQESLMDFHLYSVERPTTIADNQTKQLALLSADAIPVRHEYLLSGSDYYYRSRYGELGQKLKPAVFVSFDNKSGELGKPLPAGIVRVYAMDSKGAAQFVGEDSINHTAKNETIKLRLGEAFDITADRKQTNYKKLGETMTETSYRIDLRNAKDEAVTVRVQEPLFGDWEITQENHRSTKESSSTAVWNINVPANGSAVLEYTARVKW